MTADTPVRSATPPAVGLFGAGRPDPTALPAHRAEPTATQKKSFADLFRGEGSELHVT
jgi:hypothetical protein